MKKLFYIASAVLLSASTVFASANMCPSADLVNAERNKPENINDQGIMIGQFRFVDSNGMKWHVYNAQQDAADPSMTIKYGKNSGRPAIEVLCSYGEGDAVGLKLDAFLTQD